MEVSNNKMRDEQILAIKKIGNSCPMSGIILLMIRFFDSFTFQGMTGLLVTYFIAHFHYSKMYDAFLSYMFNISLPLMSLIGAFIADSYLGKYNAFILSNIFLLLGHFIVMIRESLPEDAYRSMFLIALGLFLSAIGAGTKFPCLMCLAGDQFLTNQIKERDKMFSALYFSSLLGNFFANFCVPLIIEKWCYSTDCFLMYFGTSFAFVTLCIVIVLLCKKLFFKDKPKGFKLLEIFKCIQFAIKNQLNNCSWKIPRRDHWLDWASEKFSEEKINEVKIFFRIILLILPFPFFWALVEQQKLQWISQSIKMNNFLNGFPVNIADIQLLYYPVLVMSVIIFIQLPFFSKTGHGGLNIFLMKKMVIGMLFIYFSMLASSFLQIQIDKTPSVKPQSQESFIRIINLAEVPIHVTMLKNDSYVSYSGMEFPFMSSASYFKVLLDSDHQNFQLQQNYFPIFSKQHIVLEEKNKYALILYLQNNSFSNILIKDEDAHPENGLASLRFLSILDKDVFIFLPLETIKLTKYNRTSSFKKILLKRNIKLNCKIEEKTVELHLGILQFGASYLISFIEAFPTFKYWKTMQIETNLISVGWQIPQLLLCGTGEFLVIVAFRQFFYYKAPKGLEVLMQALWKSTFFSGSLIVANLKYNSFLPEWIEYFIFSSILLIVISIFFITSCYYHQIGTNFQTDLS